MSAFLRFLTLAVALIAPATAAAAPAPDNKNAAGPAVSAQARSMADLIALVKDTAKTFMPKDMYADFEKHAAPTLDPAMLPGVDPKRPFGFFAIIGEGLLQMNLDGTSVVAVIPVKTEKDFLAMLGNFGLELQKNGEVHTFQIPNFPFPGTLRFVKEYAYVGISGNKLDLKTLPDPSDIIDAGEKAAAVVRLRIDRIPQALKQAFETGLKTGLATARQQQQPEEIKDFYVTVIDTFERWAFALLGDSKEISLRLNLDPKTGNFSTELGIEAAQGSSLARSFAGLKPTRNTFADLVGPDSASSTVLQLPLFSEDLRTIAEKVVDVAQRGAESEMKGDMPAEARAAVTELFAAVRRTVKSGVADFATTLRGPDKNDQYTAVAAFSLTDSPRLEKALRAAVKVAADKPIGQFLKLDAFEVGTTKVHQITVADLMPPEPQKIFGKSNVYLAFQGDAVFAAFGAQGTEAIKELLGKKFEPKPAPVGQISISGKRLMPLAKAAGVPLEGPVGAFFGKLSQFDRLDIATLAVEGGAKLTVRFEFNVLPVISITAVGAGAAAPPPPLPVKKLAN